MSLITGCAAPGEAPTQTIDKGLSDPDKRDIAIGVISTFETGTVRPNYTYAEDLDDGRGITAGPWGVTTKWGDLLAVVEHYTEQSPGNTLAIYLPTLKTIADQQSGSTDGLTGLVEAWQGIPSTDVAFIAAQKEVFDEWYFQPAMEHAKDAGINSSLGQLIVVDTIIQHGGGDGNDGLPYIIEEIKSSAGQATTNEIVWLRTFLEVRRLHLLHPSDPDTAKAWAESVDRIDMLLEILNTGNLGLDLPLKWGGFEINTIEELR